MKAKKVLSLVLAGVMSLALAVPAFATDPPTGYAAPAAGGNEIKITGQTNTPTILVMVEAIGSDERLVLNPYQLTYTITPAAAAQGTEGQEGYVPAQAAVTSNEQIVTKPHYFASLSDVPLDVGVTAKVEKGGEVVISAKDLSTDTKTTTKSVFLFLELATAADAIGDSAKTKASAALKGEYDATASKSGNQVLFSEAGTVRTKVLQLKAAENTTEAAKAVYGAYQIYGNAVKSPATAWATADTVTADIIFTFTATVETPAANG